MNSAAHYIRLQVDERNLRGNISIRSESQKRRAVTAFRRIALVPPTHEPMSAKTLRPMRTLVRHGTTHSLGGVPTEIVVSNDPQAHVTRPLAASTS
jgi:hypothetical protein